nr:hypothetical protein [Tanacetum cinerariifolium]
EIYQKIINVTMIFITFTVEVVLGSDGGEDAWWWWCGGALLWRRCVLLLLLLTNKGWIDGNGSNSSGGFGKLGGGRETRRGEDGLEGPDGQLSMWFKHLNIPLFYHWALVRSSLSDSSSSNSRKDGASLSSDDEDEDEMTEGEEIFFSFSLLGFLEMSRGSMTCS